MSDEPTSTRSASLWIVCSLAVALFLYLGLFAVVVIDEEVCGTFLIDSALQRYLPNQYNAICSVYLTTYAPVLWVGDRSGLLLQ